MEYNTSPHGLVEIFCTGCGRSRGKHPYQGFKTVSSCADCQVGDGFIPPPEWPQENKFFGRDVGTTIEDLPKKKQKAIEEAESKPKTRKRKWMTLKTDEE